MLQPKLEVIATLFRAAPTPKIVDFRLGTEYYHHNHIEELLETSFPAAVTDGEERYHDAGAVLSPENALQFFVKLNEDPVFNSLFPQMQNISDDLIRLTRDGYSCIIRQM